MNDKVFTLTIEQVKDVFRAGVRRGTDEATAFEWGGRAGGKFYDELVSTFHDFQNTGKDFDDPTYMTWDQVRKMLQE